MSAAVSSVERRPRSPLPQVRLAILAVCEHRCGYCDQPATHVDHIDPYCDGGETSLENLIAACRWCNFKKGGHVLPADMLAEAKRKAEANAPAVLVLLGPPKQPRQKKPKTPGGRTRKTLSLTDATWAKVAKWGTARGLRSDAVAVRRLLETSLLTYERTEARRERDGS